MNRIPKKNRDLRRYVIRRDLLRLLGYFAWLAVWLLGAVSYNNNHQTYPDYRRMVGWRLALLMALAAVSGFFLFRVWKFFTDRTFCGTVEISGNSRSYSGSADPGSGGLEYDFRLNTSLKVRLDNGRYRRIRFEQKNGFYNYYHEGNRILHLHGLPYPVNTDPTGKDGCVCSACGRWHEQKKERCDNCNHSVIDPKDLI